MDFSFPTPGNLLGSDRIEFLKAFRRNSERTILQMLKTSQSGHPGGSLSCLDYLAVLYGFRLTQTNEKIVVSNGHISPAVYSVLAECGVFPHEEVIKGFRQLGSPFEGHVTRHLPGVHYGTGPLGVGTSASAGFAWRARRQETGDRRQSAIKSDQNEPQNHLTPDSRLLTPNVFCLFGDGEAQEGQVHEMALFAAKEKLGNLVAFCDYNQVQLTDSLASIMPINVAEIFKAHGWEVLEIDGHDYEAIWKAINQGVSSQDKPTLIVGHTIMGKGIPLMEPSGREYKADWHGKAPRPEIIEEQLGELKIDNEKLKMLEDFRKERGFDPGESEWGTNLAPMPEVQTGTPALYPVEELTDCRSAYGKALLDLAKHNDNVVGMTADLAGSVMTKFLKAEMPERHIECGICEQNMVSMAGALSLDGLIPFCSTFGAFMSSRAKDQARVNDINGCNVKMVSTHCGLSVGEDGATHQVLDDMGSFLGFFNTHICEPADPNHCDRIIRYVSSHFGHFYVRMGRHKIPVLTKEDGTPFFDTAYQYSYGRCDLYRPGSEITLIASGPMVTECEQARAESGIDAEIVIVSSPKHFDNTLKTSLQKTKRAIIVEDHNGQNGYYSQILTWCFEQGISLDQAIDISPKEYQLSGKPDGMYKAANIGIEAIIKALNTKGSMSQTV